MIKTITTAVLLLATAQVQAYCSVPINISGNVNDRLYQMQVEQYQRCVQQQQQQFQREQQRQLQEIIDNQNGIGLGSLWNTW